MTPTNSITYLVNYHGVQCGLDVIQRRDQTGIVRDTKGYILGPQYVLRDGSKAGNETLGAITSVEDEVWLTTFHSPYGAIKYSTVLYRRPS